MYAAGQYDCALGGVRGVLPADLDHSGRSVGVQGAGPRWGDSDLASTFFVP